MQKKSVYPTIKQVLFWCSVGLVVLMTTRDVYGLPTLILNKVYLPFISLELVTEPRLANHFSSSVVVSELTKPTAFTFARDGTMFIAEKAGVVKVARPTAQGKYITNDLPFIDLSSEVYDQWDRGLLAIAVHPNFPQQPYVYLFYVYKSPNINPNIPAGAVSRLLRVTADSNFPFIASTKPDARKILLGKNSVEANIGDLFSLDGMGCQHDGVMVQDCIPADGIAHAGADVRFGKDGALYVSTGDGADIMVADPRALRSQAIDSLAGKLLRINPETGSGYADNPFYDGDANSNRSKVIAYGFRNPFRIVPDLNSDAIYVGDVGWGEWEEINRVMNAAPRNFGWPCYEGGMGESLMQGGYAFDAKTTKQCNAIYHLERNAVSPAIYAWKHIRPGSAIILGDFFAGTTWPAEYQNALYFADHNVGWIKALQPNGSVKDVAVGYKGIVGLRYGGDQNMYFLSINSGNVTRITYVPDDRHKPIAKAGASVTVGDTPLNVQFSADGSFDPNDKPLTYVWDFGDGETSRQMNPAKQYVKKGVYTVHLTVSNGVETSAQASITIDAGRNLPSIVIHSPAEALRYQVGQTISFSGTANDAQDGDISKRIRWQINLIHNQHTHFDVFNVIGEEASFVASDHGDNTTLELCASVVDGDNYVNKKCLKLLPQTTSLYFNTEPARINLVYQGEMQFTPFEAHPVVGSMVQIGALPDNECLFSKWSIGGEASQIILATASSQTITANYECPNLGFFSFATGFEATEPPLNHVDTVDMTNGGISHIGGFCCGLTAPELGLVDEKSHTGRWSLRYSGMDTDAQSSFVYFKAIDLNIQISAPTTLGYWIYPQKFVSNTNSACVALDFVLDDGTVLRNASILDQHSNVFSPQGQCGKLKMDEWNYVEIQLGQRFLNKTIKQLLVGYDQPANTGVFRGFIDDIKINVGNANIVNQDLLGWWKFDETSGAASDSSGNNNIGAVFNTIRDTGKSGNAILLRGENNSHVSIPASASLNSMTHSLTVSAWALPHIKPEGYKVLVSRQIGTILHPDQFYLGYGLNNGNMTYKWHLGTLDGNLELEASCYTNTPLVGQWSHVAGTYDGSNLRLYVNGQLICTQPLTGKIRVDANPITIGGEENDSVVRNVEGEFNGLVDDVRIFSRALSDAEIMKIYLANGQ